MSVIVLRDKERASFEDASTFYTVSTAGSSSTVTGPGILYGFTAFSQTLSSGMASYTNTVTIDGTSYTTTGGYCYFNRYFENSFIIPAGTTAWYSLLPPSIIPLDKMKLSGVVSNGTGKHRSGTLNRVGWSLAPTSAGWNTSTTPVNVSGRGILNSIQWYHGAAGPDVSQFVASITVDSNTAKINLCGPSCAGNSGNPTVFAGLYIKYKSSLNVTMWAYRNNTPGYTLNAAGDVFYTSGAW